MRANFKQQLVRSWLLSPGIFQRAIRSVLVIKILPVPFQPDRHESRLCKNSFPYAYILILSNAAGFSSVIEPVITEQ